jgi:hypothetical protein
LIACSTPAITWKRPPTKGEIREIVRRYHEVQNEAKVPPLDVIEFERQLHAGASNEFYADRDGIVRRLRSNYTHAEATWTQGWSDWIGARSKPAKNPTRPPPPPSVRQSI